MALIRSMLKGMGLTDEQVGAIIEEHTNVTDSLKQQRDQYKEESEKVPKLQQELDDLKKDVDSKDFDEWKKKYEQEHADFEKYKADVLEQENTNKVKLAYRKLLAECKVGEKHIDSIMRVTNFKEMKLTEDGSLDDAEGLKKQIIADYDGFIPSQETQGADVETPPATGGKDNNTTGRAAQLAAKYHENLYGKKED